MLTTLQDFTPYLNKQGIITKAPATVLQDWFIFRSVQIFGSLYEYQQVKYQGSKVPVLLFCTQCQSYFLVTPDSHINKHNGCPCTHSKGRWTTERFILEGLEKFGDAYDYSSVEFNSVLDKVTIVCATHGPFKKVVRDHLSSELLHGCPSCSSKAQSTQLYLIRCNTTNLFKIGVSNNPMVRKSQIGVNLEILRTWEVGGTNQPQIEKKLHNRYKALRRTNPMVRSGNTEFFQLTPQDVQDLLIYMDEQHWRR